MAVANRNFFPISWENDLHISSGGIIDVSLMTDSWARDDLNSNSKEISARVHPEGKHRDDQVNLPSAGCLITGRRLQAPTVVKTTPITMFMTNSEIVDNGALVGK
jgi:hypothetical protein